ncbi:MAG TPA: F0F1 ATP synthase subunit delta [Verrucomicrobiae bacterium]|jgi:F-type H+-transporting ATPase subunit delta
MKISKQARRDAKQLFQACKANGVLDDSRALQAVAAVIAQKPRGYVGILHHLQRLVKLDLARRTALVESAVPLAPALQESLKANLARKHGAGLNISFAPNAALIGGLRIKVGSDVYDGSIAARLESLAESF